MRPVGDGHQQPVHPAVAFGEEQPRQPQLHQQDFVDEATRKKIENLGQAYYTSLNLVPISGRLSNGSQQKVQEAVYSVNSRSRT